MIRMNKGKLIPIIIIAVLALIIVYLVCSKAILGKVKTFEHFSIEYNHEVTTYDEINVNNVIVVNNVSFWVVSVEGNKVVLNSNVNFNKDGESSEFAVELEKPKTVCFEENNCATFSLT